MNLSKEVRDFLDPIDSRAALVHFGEAVGRAAITKPAISKVLRRLHSSIPSPMVKGEPLALYDRLRGIGTHLNLPDVHEPVRPLLAVLYLRAKAALEHVEPDTFPDLLQRNLKKLQSSHQMLLNQEFLGELLVETEIRAGRDRSFAQRLTEAADELTAASPDLGRQMDSTGSAVSEKGKCIVCREDPETGEVICGEAKNWVCWVIIVIIIVIIVISL
jgi:hypothetical protein